MTAVGTALRRISARVFAHPKQPGGGNPVTIFLASPFSPSDRTALAQSCEWESVFAELPGSDASEQGQKPLLSFHLPNGDEVPFCAHAALGAAAAIAHEQQQGSSGKITEAKIIDFTTTTDETVQRVSVSANGEAELCLTATHSESDIPDFLALGELRDALGLRMEDVSLGGTGLPSYINSSIARNKTLFPMLEMDRLHRATNPKDSERFRDLCDEIKSTGIYLYSPIESNKKEDDDEEEETESDSDVEVLRYECRQFPRYSGYPEDPATGIAAAALAASLQKRGFGVSSDAKEQNGKEDDALSLKHVRYEFYQGTEMRRPSKIGVRFDEGKNEAKELTMYISGLVDILEQEDVELPSHA